MDGNVLLARLSNTEYSQAGDSHVFAILGSANVQRTTRSGLSVGVI